MQYQVELEDITKGYQNDGKVCALAKAVHRQNENFWPLVNNQFIESWIPDGQNPSQYFRAYMMPSAGNWVDRFDDNKTKVGPCRLVIYHHPIENEHYAFIADERNDL